MSIVPPLSYRSSVCSPFTDYLNVTTPRDNGELVLGELRPLLDALGASEVSDGLFALPDKGGTFKMHFRQRVAVLGASGGFLSSLRSNEMYAEYLRILSGHSHRVSMLHATVDFMVDAPEVVQQVEALGHAGGLALTRKAIQPQQIHALLSLGQDGRRTGTLYLGNRKNSDVWAKLYDKQHERLSKGLPDPGPLARLEIAVQSDIGATLRDAFDPSALFWHFASRSLVDPPPDAPQWQPYGEGFTLTPPALNLTGIQRLKAILEYSPDVSRLVKIAREEYGDEGGEVLAGLVRKLFNSRGVGVSYAA